MTPGAQALEGLHPPGRRTLVGAYELLRALVRKELKVKYKRTLLGFLWSLITPVALAAVYLFVFIYVYKVPQRDFVLFLLTGLLPWQYFNMSVLAATASLVDNAPMIRKVLFPRELIPISSVVANMINFLAGLVLLVVWVILTGRPVWTQVHWLVLAIVLETSLAVGASLTLSILNVYFRDVRQLIGILLLVLFFATPIVYDVSLVPGSFRFLLWMNPMASVMDLYRVSLYSLSNPDPALLLSGPIGALALVAVGVWIFRRFNPEIAKEV